MKKLHAFTTAIVGLLAAAPAARCEFIRPDTATASSEFTSGFDARAVNTINGTGLPAGFGPSDLHAAYASGNHWTSAAGTSPASQFITWGFAAPVVLDAIHIWNHLSTTPPANNPGYDVTLFDLTVYDVAGGVLLFLDDVALAADTAAAQTFSFGRAIAGVSSVRFDVEAVQSSTGYTGLAEVGFNSAVAAVPEPSSIVAASIALGFLGGACSLRRRRD